VISYLRLINLNVDNGLKLELLFDLKTDNISIQIIMNDKAPKLRTDIEVIPANYQGQSGIIVKDPLGLIGEPVFLYGEVLNFMSLIDGKRENRDIQYEIIRGKGGMLIGMDEVNRLLNELDEMFILDSQRYRQAKEKTIKEYSLLKVRKPVLAGQSYPANKEELKKFLDDFFDIERSATAAHKPTNTGVIFVNKASQKNKIFTHNSKGYPAQRELENKNIYALISPHIEMVSGRKVYASAFRAIEHLKPKKIILVGTGHAMREAFVSITEKDFETPLGVVKTDRDLVKELREKGKEIAVPYDMAHRSEHSLEIQLVFLQHFFGNEFTIVPLLFGSFESEFDRVTRPEEIPGMTGFLETLKKYFSENSEETLIIAGVDLSHIGPKFGHDLSAPALLPGAKKHDQQVIEAVCKNDVKKLWETVAGVKDRFNVCGFSTLACLLEILPGSQGVPLGYDIYNEEQTNSAVTFTAVAMTGK
jgi:AmmeMemoRadiSam system protein B